MAITLTNSKLTDTLTPSSPMTAAFTSATTANRGIIVHVTGDNSLTISTPTDTVGNTFILVGSRTTSDNTCQCKTYYVKQGIGGTDTVSVAYTGTATFFSVGICEITDSGGNANGFVLDQSATNSGASANGTVTTGATTVATEVVHVGMVTTGPTPTAGSGFTLMNQGTVSGHGEEWKSVSATGTQVCAFTSGSGSWAVVASTYYTATGAAAAKGGTMSLMGVG